MPSSKDNEQIPLLWINLNRSTKRRARMEWALKNGGWKSHRFIAIDAEDKNQHFLALPNLLKGGTRLPGLYRIDEAKKRRLTSRSELACLASWKHLLLSAEKVTTPSDWLLLMEDDLGASLAKPEAWAHSLLELIEYCPRQTLAIQLAPISATVRHQLAADWQKSQGKCLAVAKEGVRSHGNGAILIHKRALNLLIDPLLLISNFCKKNWHTMLHPWRIRPVADKWFYGTLPPGSCQVATYPHFCLDAEDSTLHDEHVEAFHKPSRNITMNIWRDHNRMRLIEAQQTWDSI